jgi:hypothetical protein
VSLVPSGTDFATRPGRARAYASPRSERLASPPIFPERLNWLSPCYGLISLSARRTGIA